MTDQVLEVKLDRYARFERKFTQRLVHLILEADDRKLWAKRGYPSLHEWLVKRFQYSDSAAYRYASAARLVRKAPQIGEKLASGEVNLSTLAMAQSAIRRQERVSGERLTEAQVAEVVTAIENQSTAQAELKLMDVLPDAAHAKQSDQRKVVDAQTVRIVADFPVELVRDLDRIKDLLSHALPNASLAEIVQYLANFYTEKKPAAVKRRDKGCCEYQDTETRKICGSTHQLERDHIVPRALGGTDETENLRWLCRTHNQLAAEEKLGPVRANEWRLEKLFEERVTACRQG